MGFLHEQQRVDARQYVTFNCVALEGFRAAMNLVRTIPVGQNGEPAFDRGMSLETKMKLVSVSTLNPCARSLLLTLVSSCGRRDLALKYFKQAATFLPLNNPVYQSSEEFDYNSLMTYDTFTGRNHASGAWPLLALRSPARMFFTGGNANPKLAGPSAMDIARVKVLYPPPGVPQQAPPAPPAPPARPGKRSDASNGTQPTQPWLQVEICGGLTTTVGPVPTEAPISVNSSKALELGEKYAADMQGTFLQDDVLM